MVVLSGSGQVAISNPEALGIALAGIPAYAAAATGEPRSVLHVGNVALGATGHGWLPQHFLSRDLELLDQLGGRYDLLGYEFAAGITATVTEYPTATLVALMDQVSGHAHDGAGEGAPITTLGLAAAAVSQSSIASVGALTTTSTAFVDLAGTITLSGCLAGNTILAVLIGVVKNNTGAGRPVLGISINGTDTSGPRVEATTLLTTHSAVARAIGLVGTVTIKPRVRSNDGQSITCDGGQLLVLEVKR